MVVLVVMLAAVAAPPAVQPLERATLVLVRSLSYDRNVARGAGELRVGVVHDPAATDVVKQVIEVLSGLRGITVAGRSIGLPVAIPALPHTDWSVVFRGYDTIILCPGIDAVLPQVAEAARALDVVLLSLEPSYVGRGAALGVLAQGTKLELWVDAVEAHDQGAEFAGELLELAVPVKRR